MSYALSGGKRPTSRFSVRPSSCVPTTSMPFACKKRLAISLTTLSYGAPMAMRVMFKCRSASSRAVAVVDARLPVAAAIRAANSRS